MSTRQRTNPVIDLFIDNARDSALVHRSSVLRLERRAVNVARGVQCTLKRVVFPAEEVVAVVCVAGAFFSLAYSFLPHHPAATHHNRYRVRKEGRGRRG
jgi:hypothetical protein